MRRTLEKGFLSAVILLICYAVFTILVRFVDVRAIGPENSSVGFASLNSAVFNLLRGFHAKIYLISKIFGVLILLIAFCVLLIAVLQFVQGRSLQAVDWDMKVFVCYGVAVLIVYLVTARVSINYRPVVLDVTEGLELSYPSSHTLLAVSVCGALLLQLRLRVKRRDLRKILMAAAWVLMVLAVLSRLAAGVHWFTDIVGGILLGAALSRTYRAAVKLQYDWIK